MRMFHGLFAPATVALAALLAAPGAARAQGEAMTKEGVIAGSMNIDFKTRTQLDTSGDLKPGSAALNVQDVYSFTFAVADTVEYAGKVTRQPNLYSKLIAKKKQEAQLGFDINLSVLNPKDLKQKVAVGKWVGTVPIDTASGAYDLAGGAAKQSPLRIAIDTRGKVTGFTDAFSGRLVGKAEKKDSLAAYTFKRVVGNRTVSVVVKKSDPMRFDNIKLAKGPVDSYPASYVSGRLDYDYETGNWYTDGIRIKYSLDGKDYEDLVTGSIKWIEDPDRKTNGKGRYEFNLRWNEEKHKSGSTEAAAFDKMAEEDAFFAVDDSVPCLTGTIDYVDTYASGGGDEPVPASSKVTYKLNANKLTKQQIMSFFKLWMVCTGPTNDE
ncbi:MAG: hypothetical protein IT436_18455 [Phycisphaerales bacterium]|nr:hypothetical protein [Phycisphaerales bacterium]